MNRIVLKQGVTLTDITEDVSAYGAQGVDFELTSATGAIFIGADHPFNSIYFKMKTPNASESSIVIQYWDQQWRNVVDKRDSTKTFTQSGFISFTPDRENAWERESTNYEGESVTDLEGIVIYDKYWLKITLGGDLDPGTELQWVGFKFSDDNDLAAEYPDLVRSNVLTSFKSGKTDWEEQHVRAAEVIINDLQDRGLIKDVGQIIDRKEYKAASVSKCAEIIFRSFGDDYLDRASEALAEYNRRISKRNPTIDRNANAIRDAHEVSRSSGWLER